MLPVILSSLLVVGVGQDAASAATDDLAVSLSVVGEYARVNDAIQVKIEVEAKADTEIDTALFHGGGLRVMAGGEKLEGLTKGPSSQVPLKKGTRLTIEVPIRIGALLERSGKLGTGESVDVEFSMPGVEGTGKVKVVPDLKDVAIEKLDLKQTRVALVTNFGTMVVAFRPDKAPNTVANFVKLAKNGFYDGTRFHRVIRDFMIQGGDPNTRDDNPLNDGTGGPGYQIDAEFSDLKHKRGVLSMARSGDPNSAGSQFFVMHGQAPHLDGQYTVFGSLSGGLDVLDRIASVAVQQSASGERSSPAQDIWLVRAIVLPAMK